MTTEDTTGPGEDFWTQRNAALEAKLDPHLTAQRDAFDGGRRKLTYLEGHAVIAQLNRIFGYGGWSYTLDQMGVDECAQGPEEDWYAQFFAVVTLRVGGASRQDLGTAEVRNTKRTDQRGTVTVRNNVRNVDSRATARKGAVTDALKRAARTFGQQFGNGLYDQDDNIYAWMAAHSLDESDPVALAVVPPAGSAAKEPAKNGPTDGLPSSQAEAQPTAAASAADPHAVLRAEVVALLSEDAEALDKLQHAPTPILPPDMDAQQLTKTKRWLEGRARLRRPAAVQIKERIAQARTREDVLTAVADAQGAKDRKTLTPEEYTALHAQGQARIAALAQGPLTARAG